MTHSKLKRKDEILQHLAIMLEDGEKITTAKLAHKVGVSEAALYRHFPSKAKMYEGLIEFIETSLFSRINNIAKESFALESKCKMILELVIAFADRNPGMCRILSGEALAGENERLKGRVDQLFNRMETQLKQLFKQEEATQKIRFSPDSATRANLLISVAEGRIQQFVRSGFTQSPKASWDNQWLLLAGITSQSN